MHRPPSSDVVSAETNPPRCPICAKASRVRHVHSVAEIAAQHTPPARDADRYERMVIEVSRLWPGGFVEACTCDACRLGFARPMVEGDASFYALLHERAGYPRERWEFIRARENFVGATGRVLDVGAGRGDFLSGLPAGVGKHGVEASAGLCGELVERGITAHPTLESAAAAGPFDVVTMFHVLQYFADPVGALKRCARMLKQATDEGGGWLLLTLPDATSGGGAIDVLPSPPHPLTRWTKPALERAVAAAGLEIDGFAWIPVKASTLLWAANARTRRRAVDRPRSFAGRADAMTPGRLRTAALLGLSMLTLPGVLRHAGSLLRRSQMFCVCKEMRTRFD